METTFVIDSTELNESFLESLRVLFKGKRQLQISISVSEDFNLLKQETPQQYLDRLEKCMKEVEERKNVVVLSEQELDDMVFEKL
jgi:archaellum component FlaC